MKIRQGKGASFNCENPLVDPIGWKPVLFVHNVGIRVPVSDLPAKTQGRKDAI